jgi:hypothetical protein
MTLSHLFIARIFQMSPMSSGALKSYFIGGCADHFGVKNMPHAGEMKSISGQTDLINSFAITFGSQSCQLDGLIGRGIIYSIIGISGYRKRMVLNRVAYSCRIDDGIADCDKWLRRILYQNDTARAEQAFPISPDCADDNTESVNVLQAPPKYGIGSGCRVDMFRNFRRQSSKNYLRSASPRIFRDLSIRDVASEIL